MKIRKLEQGDKGQTEHFFSVMGEVSSSFFNVDHGNEKRVAEFFENGKKDHEFFVLDRDGEIIGLAFIWDVFSRIPKFGIAVRDDAQGKGVGTFFLTSLLLRLCEEGYSGVLLTTATDNIRAQRLYERCGFERLGVAETGQYVYIRRFLK